MARGTASDLSDGAELWLFIYNVNRLYYPQSDNALQGTKIRPDASGNWSVQTYLGTPTSGGPEVFNLVLFVADAQASAQLQKTMQEWAIRNSFPGIPAGLLPPSMREIQMVTVRRPK